jgi:hypothetical protein
VQLTSLAQYVLKSPERRHQGRVEARIAAMVEQIRAQWQMGEGD